MGKKSKKNPAYRTKEQLVKDVTTVLNADLRAFGRNQRAAGFIPAGTSPAAR
jgi:hypothetical protein